MSATRSFQLSERRVDPRSVVCIVPGIRIVYDRLDWVIFELRQCYFVYRSNVWQIQHRLRLQPDLQRSAHCLLIGEFKRVPPYPRYYSVVVLHSSVAADLCNLNVICGSRGVICKKEIKNTEKTTTWAEKIIMVIQEMSYMLLVRAHEIGLRAWKPRWRFLTAGPHCVWH